MSKILIVDDEPMIRLLLREILEELEDIGVELIAADNGEDAIETIKNEKPELIFLDVMMPKMNGFEVCNIVKNELGLKHIRIIMLTAKGQKFDKQKAKESGVDFYITKPFNPDDIFAKAVEILGINVS
jgi:CheY-like chemotaxis protein